MFHTQNHGAVAEWLCRGLQLLVRRFDSGPHLHFFDNIFNTLIDTEIRFSHKVSSVFPGSSAVEQLTVNQLVAGSNPARGAILYNCLN